MVLNTFDNYPFQINIYNTIDVKFYGYIDEQNSINEKNRDSDYKLGFANYVVLIMGNK